MRIEILIAQYFFLAFEWSKGDQQPFENWRIPWLVFNPSLITITFLFSKVSRASKTIGSLLKNNGDCQYSIRFCDLHFFSMQFCSILDGISLYIQSRRHFLLWYLKPLAEIQMKAEPLVCLENIKCNQSAEINILPVCAAGLSRR